MTAGHMCVWLTCSGGNNIIATLRQDLAGIYSTFHTACTSLLHSATMHWPESQSQAALGPEIGESLLERAEHAGSLRCLMVKNR